MTESPHYRLPKAVVAMGVVSLFTDASSEMIVPLLPAFLTVQLGASIAFFGVIEGAAEAVASLLKLVSGRWSDRMGKRLPFVLFGYSLSSLTRPLMAVCWLPWQVLATRVADRIGKGLRSAPRDALLTAAIDPKHRGFAFGFHRAMDHAGAVIGALLATGLLALGLGTREVFAWAAVPGVLAVVAILLGVKEQPRATSVTQTEQGRWRDLDPQLLRYLTVLGVFTLANSSDAFLLLKAGEAGIPLTLIPLLWIVLHVTKMTTNLFGGRLSDRIGALPVIRWSWGVYGIVYALFGFATAAWQVWVLFAMYGLYHGLSEGAEKSLVAQLAKPEQRGQAFGLYHAMCGIVALPASLWMGLVWEHLGSRTAFSACAVISILASIGLRRLLIV
jgi:MFS family permease